ncbi:G2-specific serine/threonine protein kinase [Modicella reniformis]|uniref:non-specific serine/threonine protein kinase n=1 Tax=Modicella reniformis TaxID=1440133 RepID=A0A9P6INT2_9FUNG|nr:G2-specific serine/threonine protein kinase [Modicella reniformis]
MQQDVFHMDDYEALESIGSGSFGLIRKVRRKSDGKILARKEIDYRRMSQKEKEQLVAEVNILRDLKHPNIVEFLERVIDRENSFIYILMEYCEGGDLAAVIKRHREKMILIPEVFVWNIMTQLILALHECHCGVTKGNESDQPTSRPILHRDLKPDNVFLDSKKNVKLGDFGLSRSLTNPQRAFAQTYVGTPYYMSPELITDSSYDIKSDIWSLGCIVFEMCALEPPFLADTQAELNAKIKLGRIPMLPPQYSQELGLIVRAMLQVNPRKRPTTTELLSNPRIRNTSEDIELKRRTSELEVVQRSLMERENRIKEREAFFAGLEKNFKAADQRLREMETALNSREETIRAMESTLSEREKKLSWEQQRLDELRRELTQEQERRRIALSQKALSDKHSEPMAIDQANPQAGVNGKSSATTATASTSQLPFMPSMTQPTNPTSTLEQYFNTRALSMALAADPAHTAKTTPRRKSGLSAGRYSLQTTNNYRATGATGPNANGSLTRPTISPLTGTLDNGTSQTSGQSSGVSIGNQRLNTHGLSVDSTDNPSTTSISLSGQPVSYQGIGGMESRLSAKFVLTPGLNFEGSANPTVTPSPVDPRRLRSKSKSTSTLIASMSSTSLSSMPAANPSNGAPSAATESANPSSTVPSTSTFNFTPAIPVKALPSASSTLNSQGSTSANIQVSATSEPTFQRPATPSNGTNFLRPAAPTNGSSGRNLASLPPQSSSSSSSSAINTYSSRRAHTPGMTPSISHMRSNPTLTSASSRSSDLGTTTAAAPSTSAVNTPASNNGQLPSMRNATSNGSSSQDLSSTPPKSQNVTPMANERTNLDRTPEIARQESEDFRMEWDDIPSPFIKKTFMRPPPSGAGGSSFSRKLFGS